MTGTSLLAGLMRQALERGFSGTRAYRYARLVADDRSRSDQEREHAADDLRRFLSAREGLVLALQELKAMEEFEEAAQLRDLTFAAALRRLRETLARLPLEPDEAEAVLAEATRLWDELRKLKQLFEETTAGLEELLERASEPRSTDLSLLLKRVRFDISAAAACVHPVRSVLPVSPQGALTSPEDDRLLQYRTGLLERARTALPAQETLMYAETFERLSKGPDTMLNRRMMWSIVHQLRRRLFASLDLMQSNSTYSERATRPPMMSAISNFWTAFQRLHALIQEGNDQVKYLLDQLVGALLAPEAERVRRTTVVCNVLTSIKLREEDYATAAPVAEVKGGDLVVPHGLDNPSKVAGGNAARASSVLPPARNVAVPSELSLDKYAVFLNELESTTMNRSYKMLLLLAMLDLDLLPGAARLSDLAREFARIAGASPLLVADVSVDLSDLRAVERLLERQPIRALTGGYTNEASPWFSYSAGTFRAVIDVADDDRDAFVAALRVAVNRRLHAYLENANPAPSVPSPSRKIKEIRHRSSIEAAISECDSLGRDAFLHKYGFGRASQYFLRHSDRDYDSKAIVGAAFAYEYPGEPPLANHEFSGGRATVGPLLKELGFKMVVRLT